MLNQIPASTCNQIEDILEACDINVLQFSVYAVKRGCKRLTPQRLLLRALDYVCRRALVPQLCGTFFCGYDGDKFVVISRLSTDDIRATLESVPILSQNYAWDYLWETFVRENNNVK